MHFSNSHRNGNSMVQKAAHSIYCAVASHFPIWFWNVKNLRKERRQCIHERPDLFNCVYLLTSLLFPMSQKQSTTHTLMDISPWPRGQKSNIGLVSSKGSIGQFGLGATVLRVQQGFPQVSLQNLHRHESYTPSTLGLWCLFWKLTSSCRGCSDTKGPILTQSPLERTHQLASCQIHLKNLQEYRVQVLVPQLPSVAVTEISCPAAIR